MHSECWVNGYSPLRVITHGQLQIWLTCPFSLLKDVLVPFDPLLSQLFLGSNMLKPLCFVDGFFQKVIFDIHEGKKGWFLGNSLKPPCFFSAIYKSPLLKYTTVFTLYITHLPYIIIPPFFRIQKARFNFTKAGEAHQDLALRCMGCLGTDGAIGESFDEAGEFVGLPNWRFPRKCMVYNGKSHHGWFPKMVDIPNSWMVYWLENPIDYKWMI